MNDELFVAALAFVGDGLPVFPCKPRGKLPMVKGGFKAATVDTEQVRKWWSKWRQANIGIPTGAVSGFVVLDIDPGGDDSLATLTGSHGPLPETRAVKTGRGRQLWFKYPSVPVRCSAGVLGLGLDFRGDGGYVIAPPSIHQNGQRYAFLNNCELAEMSDWLINVIQQGKSAPNPTPHSDGSGGKIREGARNATLASIAGTMRKRGLGETAIRAALLEHNSRECDPPLSEAEVAGVAASVASYAPAVPGEAAERRAKLECFAQIQPKPLRWVWRARVPSGKLSLIIGDPDKGKSLLTIDIAARITTGKPFPDGAPSERGTVIMLSAEDDAEDTTRPRLDAAGADVSRVNLLKAVRVVLRDGKQVERGFSLESDIDALDDAIKQTPDARLIVIDPVSAYLGGADSHNNAEVRGLLAPLAELAARTGVAILAVTHLRKSGGAAIYRAMGSLAFAAAARAVWGIAEDAEKRIMVRVKGNLSHDPGGLAYRIDVTSGIPVIAWEPGVVDMRADDVLGGLDSREDRCERREAEAWLKDFLARGPKPASEVERQSKRAGFAPATVRRASDALRVKKQKSGFDSGWEWRLPERAQSEDAHPVSSAVSTFETAIEKKRIPFKMRTKMLNLRV
jgi:archaellum biogenesis ATPase FlaH